MTEFIEKYKDIWGEDPRKLLAQYDYQRELTAKLDVLKPEELNTQTFYEIYLWKLNRFPRIKDGLLAELKDVAKINPKEHRNADDVLKKLLSSPGIALPMASTILRFLNPSVFQIIDDRVYRIVRPQKTKYPPKPPKLNDRYLSRSTGIYFDYLDDLHNLSSNLLPFESADRILYILDIERGNKIGDKF